MDCNGGEKGKLFYEEREGQWKRKEAWLGTEYVCMKDSQSCPTDPKGGVTTRTKTQLVFESGAIELNTLLAVFCVDPYL